MDRHEGMSRPAPPPAIRLDDVVRRQGAFTLGPFDMIVPAGMVTGFVGPNGAGKTTVIKVILGMIGVDAGSISVLDGAPGARHERIGVVLDSVALPRDWTAVSAARSLERFYPDWDRSFLDELVDRLDVSRTCREGRASSFSSPSPSPTAPSSSSSMSRPRGWIPSRAWRSSTSSATSSSSRGGRSSSRLTSPPTWNGSPITFT